MHLTTRIFGCTGASDRYADSGYGPVFYPDPPGRARFARADVDEAAQRLAEILHVEAAGVLISYESNAATATVIMCTWITSASAPPSSRRPRGSCAHSSCCFDCHPRRLARSSSRVVRRSDVAHGERATRHLRLSRGPRRLCVLGSAARRVVARTHTQRPQRTLKARGRGWHLGQKNDERFMNFSRRITAPQRRQFFPSRP